MNDSPFTTHGDEPVEARIVSWVLGEASAFEAAELERLCEERPELMVFKRRMLALHGLLTEAESARPDDDKWRLPPEKRKAVDVLFGEQQPIRLEVEKEKRIRHNGRRALLAIAACLILTVIVAGLTSPMVIRQRKKSDVAEARSLERQRELAAFESNAPYDTMQSLRTEIPPELLEGTPKPMNVPNLERPVSGPAGSATWSMADRMAESRKGTEGEIHVGGHVRSPGAVDFKEDLTLGEAVDQAGGATAFGTNKRVILMRDGKSKSYDITNERFRQIPLQSGDAVELAQKRPWSVTGDDSTNKSEPSAKPARQPAPPSSSMAKVVAANTAPATSVPVPDVDASAPPLDFGAADAFAAGVDGVNSELAAIESDAKPADSSVFRSPGARIAFGEDENGRLGELRSSRRSADPTVAKVTEAEPFAEDGLASREQETKTGSGALSYNSSGVMPADELVTGGNRSGIDSIKKSSIDGILRRDVQGAGELASNAEKQQKWGGASPVTEAVPVLGRLFSLDEKNDHSGNRDYESSGTLSGNTYSGGTTVTGRALGIGGSGGVEKNVPAEQPAALGMIDGDDSVRSNSELADAAWKDKKSNLKPEAPAKGKSEYFSRIADSAKAKAVIPDETVARASCPPPAETMPEKAAGRMPVPLTDEIPAAQDPYSTFSLNISDASFQVAQAALAKGEQPDPAGIKVEQFYNAVDYGDPAPAANESVAVNIEQSAHPVIPGRNLVRIALKTAAAGRSAAQPLRLTLLVDQSGSMVREDRRAAMDKALAGLSELLTKNDLVTVIGFSRTSRLLADGMTGDKAGKLADLVNQSASEGGTNLEEAIKLGEQLADRRKLAGAQNRIVLFTDGAANLGNADPARLAEHVKQLRQKGIAFDIAGIAVDGLNDELLGELARNGNGRYYVVGKGADADFAKQLAGAFRPAAENVKVQVRFNPERVGRYKLIGFEKDRLKTEDFRNDKVDAAELAAEEAGVAIYQVETLPEGNGELGEVSVRFRDTTRGEMVERAWTIPHDAAAPAIDGARPSMQLAVLAMLAGEKLKGGPLADAIDFKQLADSIADVKQFYGGDGRVGGMLRVVELLK